MRLTVGPLPASVYWRRRAIVLAGALLVVFLVAQACIAASASPGGDSPGGQPSPDPTGTPHTLAGSAPPDGGSDTTDDPDVQPQEPAEEPAEEPPADADVCTDDEMLVTALAERTAFSPGERVQFTIRIRNDSNRTCHRDIGGDLRELRLNQGTGATAVWSSQGCGGPSGTNHAALPPGHEEEYFLVWNGRSSASCENGEPGGPVVEPGEYQLTARLGSVHSEPVTLTLR